MPATQVLIHHIKTHGTLSIADFMAFALFHPAYGYYTTQNPFGSKGDFITAPEISQVFGELIGIWCATTWENMGKPDDLILAEIGPGRGTLMQDLLRGTAHIEGFHKAISVHLVEVSPALTTIQKNTLKSYPHIQWHTDCNSLPAGPALIVANELFDALPIHQWITHDHFWYERHIGLTPQDTLTFVRSTTPSASSDQPEGTIMETSPAAIAMMKQITSHIMQHGGASLIIDYGYEEPAYGDTLQAIKSHHYAAILNNIGTQDITAHVNFSALKKIALDASLTVDGPIPQGQFLHNLGIELRTEQLLRLASDTQRDLIKKATLRLVSPDQMGVLFKVLTIAHPAVLFLTGC